MRLDKFAQVANIAAVFPGLYSAYAAYVLLHPQQQTQQLPPSHAGASAMVNETGLLAGLATFSVCIVAAAVLNSIALFRNRDAPLPPSTSATPIPTPIPTPTAASVIEQPRPEERIFIDVTPEYLAGFFKEHTDIQAQRLLSAYIGKWMESSGHLGEVSRVSFTELLQVSFQEVAAVTVIMFFSLEWADRLSVIKRGSPITVIGKIERAGGNFVSFYDCELISQGQHSSPIVQT
jgi:hypothetical protein